VAKRGTTQRITAKDVGNGRIRIPITGLTKGILPREIGKIEVVLKGTPLGRVKYDPRFGPDRERSGVFSIPRRVLEQAVFEDEVLPVVSRQDGLGPQN
jgi:hypothetical protein